MKITCDCGREVFACDVAPVNHEPVGEEAIIIDHTYGILVDVNRDSAKQVQLRIQCECGRTPIEVRA